eukprot:TRINITY_DN1827_c0_g1_i1.p1 TRINITY_DN1827_c0_g1~~TRINITY_DN1827_c0_g1_i1.p1  ORF type:complete len:545 (-),score=96.98 TRINITY_DN1827_c0_g1_i1:307-1941(-)
MPLQHFDRLASAQDFGQAVHNAEHRLGHIAVAGRLHQPGTRALEDDFIISKEVLGSGFNGSVFLAKSRYTGESVAIKQLCTKDALPEEKHQLAGELEVFLSMDHPHVARLMGVYEADDCVSLVMECMSGGELFDRAIEKKIFEESEAAHATWQMLLAVNYLHHEGVTHRDLKLENFLYDTPGSDYLKLIDFGFSKFCKNKKFKEALGTLTYVAPEVLKRSYDGRACDLWSLGCVSFILLFGHMPFSAKDDDALARLIVRGAYRKKAERWDSVSSDARDFVQKLLVVNPDRRLTAKEALAHPFISSRVSRSTSAIDASTARGFLSFARADKFKRASLQVMAWSLSLGERRKLRDAFVTTGLDQDGIMKLDDIERLFRDKFPIPSTQLASVMKGLRALDNDGDGELHFSDFLACVMASKLEQGTESVELLQETFRRFDIHGLGYIRQEAFIHVVGDTSGVCKIFNQPHLATPGRMNMNEFIDELHKTDDCPDSLSESSCEQLPCKQFSKRAWIRRTLASFLPSCMGHPSGSKAQKVPLHLGFVGGA